jgi:hypothetical protein
MNRQRQVFQLPCGPRAWPPAFHARHLAPRSVVEVEVQEEAARSRSLEEEQQQVVGVVAAVAGAARQRAALQGLGSRPKRQRSRR